MTRAAENLTVVSPSINAYGKEAAGLPIFVQEAGLMVGQNVPGKAAPAGLVDPLLVDDDAPARSVLAYYNIHTASQESEPDDAGYDWRAP
jgi:hypothetical protein